MTRLCHSGSHRTICGAVWRCHVPFCPEVKGMPSFKWLKIIEGKLTGNPQNSRNSPNISYLFYEKRVNDICMLLDAMMIIERAVHSVNLMAKMRIE